VFVRNGRFLLRCPSTVLAAAMVKEMEDALNLATVQPLDAFVNLRTKCLLHYFGLIGRSLNLKVSSYFLQYNNRAKS
jgi:mediator of RNA polymerase II transcription subunit 14